MLLLVINVYITNIDDAYPEHRMYKTNKYIASWLINRNIPLLGKSKDGRFCFAKTDLLKEVLENLPFYYKIADYF